MEIQRICSRQFPVQALATLEQLGESKPATETNGRGGEENVLSTPRPGFLEGTGKTQTRASSDASRLVTKKRQRAPERFYRVTAARDTPRTMTVALDKPASEVSTAAGPITPSARTAAASRISG
jgi:hypothetical protein